MFFIRQFNQLSKADITIAGGKGASLGEMTKAGFSIFTFAIFNQFSIT